MTPKEKAAIIEEAKKHEPDIWSDEYFPYWEKVYSQFEEEEDKEIKEYKVKHYHTKVLGLTFEEVPAKEDYTEYTISASTAKEAAVIAHGLYNGYSLKEMAPDPAVPYRTIREQLEDTVKASPVGKNTKEKSVFLYDNIARHVITVEEETSK